MKFCAVFVSVLFLVGVVLASKDHKANKDDGKDEFGHKKMEHHKSLDIKDHRVVHLKEVKTEKKEHPNFTFEHKGQKTHKFNHYFGTKTYYKKSKKHGAGQKMMKVHKAMASVIMRSDADCKFKCKPVEVCISGLVVNQPICVLKRDLKKSMKTFHRHHKNEMKDWRKYQKKYYKKDWKLREEKHGKKDKKFTKKFEHHVDPLMKLTKEEIAAMMKEKFAKDWQQHMKPAVKLSKEEIAAMKKGKKFAKNWHLHVMKLSKEEIAAMKKEKKLAKNLQQHAKSVGKLSKEEIAAMKKEKKFTKDVHHNTKHGMKLNKDEISGKKKEKKLRKNAHKHVVKLSKEEIAAMKKVKHDEKLNKKYHLERKFHKKAKPHFNIHPKTRKTVCGVNELAQMKTRMMGWFHLLHGQDKKARKSHGGSIGKFYKHIASKKEVREYNGMTCQCMKSAMWQFNQMDKNQDKHLHDGELTMMVENTLEPCMKPYLASCDTDGDKKINADEWCCCFTNVLPPCYKQLNDMRRSGQPAFNMPRCDKEGYYMHEQCKGGDSGVPLTCWCVDYNGNEYKETAKQGRAHCHKVAKYGYEHEVVTSTKDHEQKVVPPVTNGKEQKIAPPVVHAKEPKIAPPVVHGKEHKIAPPVVRGKEQKVVPPHADDKKQKFYPFS